MREFSYGIIPLKKSTKQGWQVLLVKHLAGHWAFPKGHPDGNETPLETAERELFEETGLKIKHFFSEYHSLKENYFFYWEKKKIFKTVEYFLAEVQGKVVLQEKELMDIRWIPLNEAEDLVTFSEGKKICREVLIMFEKKDINWTSDKID